jgi:hypothetical protein
MLGLRAKTTNTGTLLHTYTHRQIPFHSFDNSKLTCSSPTYFRDLYNHQQREILNTKNMEMVMSFYRNMMLRQKEYRFRHLY